MASLATRRRGTVCFCFFVFFSFVSFFFAVAKVQSLCYRLLIPLLLLRFGLWVKRHCLQRHLSVESSMRSPGREFCFAICDGSGTLESETGCCRIRHSTQLLLLLLLLPLLLLLFLPLFLFSIFKYRQSAAPPRRKCCPATFYEKIHFFLKWCLGRRRVVSSSRFFRRCQAQAGFQRDTRAQPPAAHSPSHCRPTCLPLPALPNGTLCSLLLAFGKSNWDLD